MTWKSGGEVARGDELHRWYDAGVGRWLSQDPIGFAAGDANLYRYVGNGATNATDPSGLSRDRPHDDGTGPDPESKFNEDEVSPEDLEPKKKSRKDYDEKEHGQQKEELDQAKGEGGFIETDGKTDNKDKQELKDEADNALDDLRGRERTWVEFAHEHKGWGFIIGAGVCVGTIAEDVVTGGVGLADDPLTLGVGGGLMVAAFY